MRRKAVKVKLDFRIFGLAHVMHSSDGNRFAFSRVLNKDISPKARDMADSKTRHRFLRQAYKKRKLLTADRVSGCDVLDGVALFGRNNSKRMMPVSHIIDHRRGIFILGIPHINIGIFDSGLLTQHQSFVGVRSYNGYLHVFSHKICGTFPQTECLTVLYAFELFVDLLYQLLDRFILIFDCPCTGIAARLRACCAGSASGSNGFSASDRTGKGTARGKAL